MELMVSERKSTSSVTIARSKTNKFDRRFEFSYNNFIKEYTRFRDILNQVKVDPLHKTEKQNLLENILILV